MNLDKLVPRRLETDERSAERAVDHIRQRHFTVETLADRGDEAHSTMKAAKHNDFVFHVEVPHEGAVVECRHCTLQTHLDDVAQCLQLVDLVEQTLFFGSQI